MEPPNSSNSQHKGQHTEQHTTLTHHQIWSTPLPLKITGVDNTVFPSTHFLEVFVNDLPLLDVRAEVEFEKGAFLRAHNLPILNNNERDLVGKCYKKNGSEAAIKLGQDLVDGPPLEERVKNWKQFLNQNPGTLLYCFRGGFRSQYTQKILYFLTGILVPRIEGGYKALRNFLQQSLHNISLPAGTTSGQATGNFTAPRFLIIGGKTGVGKTDLIKRIRSLGYTSAIDLEDLANHRGSAFGQNTSKQPTQINFENSLAQYLLKITAPSYSSNVNTSSANPTKEMPILLENEGQAIGRVQIPSTFFKKMQSSSIVILERSNWERENYLIKTYMQDRYEYYLKHYNAPELSSSPEYQAICGLNKDLSNSLTKIEKKLGGARYQELIKDIQLAQEEYLKNESWEGYRPVVAKLMQYYYDPFYTYNEQQKSTRIAFKGNEEEVIEFLTSYV